MKLIKDVYFDRLVWEKDSDHMEPPPIKDELTGEFYIPILDRDSEGFLVEVDRVYL